MQILKKNQVNTTIKMVSKTNTKAGLKAKRNGTPLKNPSKGKTV